jgi:hypothetical protein
MQLSDKQVNSVREHIRLTFHQLENEEFVTRSEELMLRYVEMTMFFVLSDIVESLPVPVQKDVKQLLHTREQLWKKVMG